MEQEYDYIIVGQGLAGSCLALNLVNKGKRILVFSDPNGKSSSRVAGGLINPITGRKMVLTWKANELFPYLDKFYREAETLLAANFYFKLPIYRPFVSIEEQNEWQGKSVEPTYSPFIKGVITQKENKNIVNDPFGGLLLDNGGYLDTNIFLDAVSGWLKKQEFLLNERFNIDLVNFTADGVVYKDVTAKRIIFCEGVSGNKNPYFTDIKFRPVKGEVLKVEMEADLNKIYNRGVFVMPRNGSYTVGSNYNHRDLTWDPTEKGKEEIEVKLKALLNKPYTIVGHKAGIRPSVTDRRPVLGASKEREQMIVFNGLGTKGVSLAPYFASQLTEWLCNGKEVDKEVRVERFFN